MVENMLKRHMAKQQENMLNTRVLGQAMWFNDFRFDSCKYLDQATKKSIMTTKRETATFKASCNTN
jgi:hypothetical protein